MPCTTHVQQGRFIYSRLPQGSQSNLNHYFKNKKIKYEKWSAETVMAWWQHLHTPPTITSPLRRDKNQVLLTQSGLKISRWCIYTYERLEEICVKTQAPPPRGQGHWLAVPLSPDGPRPAVATSCPPLRDAIPSATGLPSAQPQRRCPSEFRFSFEKCGRRLTTGAA